MKYKKDQFYACSFNPLVEGPIRNTYPDLNEIVDPEWPIDDTLESLLRFVIMVYDPKSPLVKTETDLNHRKDVAFELAGIDDEDLRMTIATHNHEFVPELIGRYLVRFAKSKEWAAICACEYCYWESIRKLMEPISAKDTKGELEAVQKKAAIKEEMDRDIARLDKYYEKFFGGDSELETKIRKNYTSPEKMLKR